MKYFTFILTMISCFGFQAGFTQEIISDGGDFFKNSYGSVSFTIGEPISETFTGTTSILTQGFQQNEYLSYGINDLSGIDYTVSIAPNPAREFIVLKVNPIRPDSLFYCLFDNNGTMLQKEQVINEDTKISLHLLPPSSYIIQVSENRKIVKTLKIIKQN